MPTWSESVSRTESCVASSTLPRFRAFTATPRLAIFSLSTWSTASSCPLWSARRVSVSSFLLNSMVARVPLKSYRTAISCWAWTTALCISAWLISLTMSKECVSAIAGGAPIGKYSRSARRIEF